MDLNTVWFILIGILFTGFFILEGFDLGVGILLPFLGKTDIRRRVIINTIGPHWDGNEVWLLTAGGAMFAAFPHWYATLFSGFYLALFLLLVGLIVRGVGIEFRSKDDNPLWRSVWDWAIFGGSLVTALLIGVAFANFITGVPIGEKFQYVGTFWDLVHPLDLLGGVVSLLGFTLQGAIFLALKTEKPLSDDARKIASRVWIPALAALILYVVSFYFLTDVGTRLGVRLGILPILAVLALGGVGILLRQKRDGLAFIANTVAILLSSAALFFDLYPNVLVSSLDPALSLTVQNAASGVLTLQTMSIVALVLVPIVLAYQGWTYWIFRKRITEKPQSLHY